MVSLDTPHTRRALNIETLGGRAHRRMLVTTDRPKRPAPKEFATWAGAEERGFVYLPRPNDYYQCPKCGPKAWTQTQGIVGVAWTCPQRHVILYETPSWLART